MDCSQEQKRLSDELALVTSIRTNLSNIKVVRTDEGMKKAVTAAAGAATGPASSTGGTGGTGATGAAAATGAAGAADAPAATGPTAFLEQF